MPRFRDPADASLVPDESLERTHGWGILGGGLGKGSVELGGWVAGTGRDMEMGDGDGDGDEGEGGLR